MLALVGVPGWITSLLALLGGGMWLVLRYFKKKDDPQNQYQSAKDEDSRIIEKRDGASANRDLDNLTDGV